MLQLFPEMLYAVQNILCYFSDRKSRIELVRKLVETLPEKQRSIIQLRDFEGKSYREIATVLGISEEQVKVYLHRARNTIKQKYTVTDKYGL